VPVGLQKNNHAATGGDLQINAAQRNRFPQESESGI